MRFRLLPLLSILALALSGISAVQASAVIAPGEESQLLLASFPSQKGSMALTLDVYNAHGISAMEFEIPVPDGAKVDTSQCLAELPPTHAGQCVHLVDRQRILVLMFSLSNEALPSGWSSLGRLTYTGPSTKGLVLSNLLASDPGGVPVAVRAQSRRDTLWPAK